MLHMSHDVFLAYLPIDCPETTLKSPKLLTLQVRMKLRQPQLEPYAASTLQIISASHLHLPSRFPCRSNCRATSQHPETLQTSSRSTTLEEQLSDTEPPSAISNHARRTIFFCCYSRISRCTQCRQPCSLPS